MVVALASELKQVRHRLCKQTCFFAKFARGRIGRAFSLLDFAAGKRPPGFNLANEQKFSVTLADNSRSLFHSTLAVEEAQASEAPTHSGSGSSISLLTSIP